MKNYISLEYPEIPMKKRDSIRNDELIAAIASSRKTYEEVIESLNTGKKQRKNRT